MTLDTKDLVELARIFGFAIPREQLERLTPAVATMYQDLEHLRELPIHGREPALPPLAPVATPRETRR